MDIKNDIKLLKNSIRKEILILRESIPDDILLTIDKQVIEKLLPIISNYAGKIDKSNLVISCYLSFMKEVPTKNLIIKLLDIGYIVCAPAISGLDMNMHQINDIDELVINKLSIFEPSSLNNILLPDIIILPLIAVDKMGNRLGFGKGYYDRYIYKISELNIRPLLLGLAYDFQLLDEVPFDRHDYALDDLIILDTKYTNKRSTF